MEHGSKGAASLADLVIAVAYFLIPLELLLYLLKRRYLWVIERRSWAVSLLFISFILLCGITHLLAIFHVSPQVVAGVKWATAIVSAATSVTLCWVIPEALSLPQYVRDITMENKLMKDFRGIMTAMRRELREDAIIDNARHKLRRVLPANTFLDISKDPVPPEFTRTPREVLSLPIVGDLSMHLRRANLNEAQVTWLHDICVQMKQALQQAAYLQLDQQYHAAAGLPAPPQLLLSPPPSYIGTGGEPSSKMATPTTATAALLPGGHTPANASSSSNNNYQQQPPAFSSQSSFTSAAAAPSLGGLNPYPPPPLPPTLPRAFSATSTTSRGGAAVAAGGMATPAAALSSSEAPSEEVERALMAELELTKLRIRSAGVLSRLQALLDVMEASDLTAEQRRVVALMREGSQLEILEARPKPVPDN